MKKYNGFVPITLFLLFGGPIFLIISNQGIGNDFFGFLIGANRLLTKHFLYEGSKNGMGVTWPPFFMVFMAPWALLAKLDIRVTQILWYCLNCFLFFKSIDVWCRIVHKKPCSWITYGEPFSLYSPFVFLPILFVASPLLYNAHELQVNILLLFFISLGIYQIEKGKERSAGIWFGLATALKAFPIIFLVYLMFQRKIKAAILMAFTATVLTLIPVVWYGPHDYLVNLNGWCAISFHGCFPVVGSAQSVYSMLARWIGCDFNTMAWGKLLYPPLSLSGGLALQWLHKGLFILVIGVFYGISIFRKNRNAAFEGAFICLVGMLFSPIAWKHYWILCFPAIFILWKIAHTHGEKVITRLLWVFLILVPPYEILIVCLAPPVCRNFLNRIASNYTIGAILLVVAMIYWVGRSGPGRWEVLNKNTLT
jgi:hypothetical protein